MKWIKNIFRELFGLFVDDGTFAIAILLWLAIVRWVLPHLPIPAMATGVILFAGLALILGESAVRYTRQLSAPQQ
jgi:hypothetical protein